ncbi:MAG: GNAT family N-acetyltransferase [Planctomycetales bacterium]|nr:GNAT family N-acetyltransferase [Planctomycetales bacterium]
MSRGPALEVGPPKDDAELKAYGDLLVQSLGFDSKLLEPWLARQERVSFRLARLGGRVAGGLLILRGGQWFGGRSVPFAGIAAVATAPDLRGKGVASRLLRTTLEELRAGKVPLSGLYPSTHVVYRRLGYEVAGVRVTWKLPTSAIDAQETGLALRPFEAKDEEAIRDLYRERASRGAGQLDRTLPHWKRILDPLGVTRYAYVIEREGKAEAYVFFTQEPTRANHYELVVRDMVAATPQAVRRLLAFFAGHRSMADSVSWIGGPGDPFFALLPNPSHRVDQLRHWMLRLVDVPAALEGRGYAPDVSASLALHVRDENFPWNEGKFTLRVEGGRGEVRPGGDGDLKVTVRGLAPLYTGHLTAEELVATGLVSGEGEALAAASRLFRGPAPWMSDAF